MAMRLGPSSVLAVVDLLFVELNGGTCGNKIEQLDDIFTAHAHTAMRRRPPQCRDIRRAVKIDIATERIDATQPIAAGLGTRQPENTREYPVATRILTPQFGGPELARPATAAPHRTLRQALAHLRSEERRDGQEGGMTCRPRWSTVHKN